MKFSAKVNSCSFVVCKKKTKHCFIDLFVNVEAVKMCQISTMRQHGVMYYVSAKYLSIVHHTTKPGRTEQGKQNCIFSH